MTDNRELGNTGEELARQHLQEQGYQILECNWQYGHLEIDIIALKDNVLAFVEVKTRVSDKFEAPQDAVNRRKQRNIIRAAHSYIMRSGFNCEARFDIISVVTNTRQTQLNHFQDAYAPCW